MMLNVSTRGGADVQGKIPSTQSGETKRSDVKLSILPAALCINLLVKSPAMYNNTSKKDMSGDRRVPRPRFRHRQPASFLRRDQTSGKRMKTNRLETVRHFSSKRTAFHWNTAQDRPNAALADPRLSVCLADSKKTEHGDKSCCRWRIRWRK